MWADAAAAARFCKNSPDVLRQILGRVGCHRLVDGQGRCHLKQCGNGVVLWVILTRYLTVSRGPPR